MLLYSNNDFACYIVRLLLLPSLWLKIILSFTAGNENSQTLYSNFYMLTDFIILLSIGIYWLLMSFDKKIRVSLLLFVLLFLLNMMTWLYNETHFITQQKLLLKLILPLCFLLFIQDYAKRFPKNVLNYGRNTVFLVVFCTAYGFVFFEPEFLKGVERFPTYFGNIHTTSYMWVGIFFILSTLTRNWKIQFLLWLIILFFIDIAWGVRTAEGALISIGCILGFTKIDNKNIQISLCLLCILIISVFVIYLQNNTLFLLSVDGYSSGRISMYIAKIDQITNSNLVTLLLGGGEGSDLILIDKWWWGEKGSHNDYLSLFVEQGLFFCIITLILFGFIIRNTSSKAELHILLVYLFTSMISNGFMMRPLAAYLLFLSVGMHIATTKRASYKRFSL